jgi:glycosyltransferase involved in cell wall biosynthesis
VSDAKLPDISVVVTCFNCRDYIGDAIRSVARQTLRDFECVIVDDASTDDSAEVVGHTLDELGDPRFSQIRLDKNVGQTGATRRGLAATKATFVCFLDSDDLWNPDFLERHLAAHLNESYAVGFTACNARLIDGQGKLIAGCVYWFGKERASADRDRAFAPIDPARIPKLDTAGRSAVWQKQTPYRLYTKRVVHWVWVSTSSMMFRRSLIDLVFPEDDETFRLHMDFYVVVMAQMVAGSLLIDEALYSYRQHDRNSAADNPVLGGRLHLSSHNWGNTYAEMLDRMLSTLARDHERRPRITSCAHGSPVATRYDERRARNEIVELSDISKRLARLPTPLKVAGWYFPVEVDPSWVDAPRLTDTVQGLPRPLWISVYDNTNVGPETLVDWLGGWLPEDVNVLFQDGVGVHAREASVARRYADVLADRRARIACVSLPRPSARRSGAAASGWPRWRNSDPSSPPMAIIGFSCSRGRIMSPTRWCAGSAALNPAIAEPNAI